VAVFDAALHCDREGIQSTSAALTRYGTISLKAIGYLSGAIKALQLSGDLWRLLITDVPQNWSNSE
jgi:hypothetical protein